MNVHNESNNISKIW